eukprot:4738965-Amphidinium_carterae.2
MSILCICIGSIPSILRCEITNEWSCVRLGSLCITRFLLIDTENKYVSSGIAKALLARRLTCTCNFPSYVPSAMCEWYLSCLSGLPTTLGNRYGYAFGGSVTREIAREKRKFVRSFL